LKIFSLKIVLFLREDIFVVWFLFNRIAGYYKNKTEIEEARFLIDLEQIQDDIKKTDFSQQKFC
jgi:hypothetical protein